jgi:antitoxin FitA
MPSIQVKDVPDEVHSVLRRRAAAAGQSLQEYLLAHLTEEATTPTLEELFEQVGQRTGGRFTAADAVAAVRADRDSR